jgi:hypothetical protein
MCVGILAIGSTPVWASSADSCYLSNGAAAECIGSYSAHTAEDYSGLSTANNCYGACGPGCNYNCSSGGPCTTHDYYTRTYGMFSSQALGAFPPALVKWGGCEVGRAVQSVGTNVFSRLTSYVNWGSTKLSGLF